MTYGHWEYEGMLEPSKHFGFLYLIINKDSGKRYIGIKQFSFTRGRKSDWQTYVSSSKWLQSDIDKLGKDNFKFIIIGLYDDKAALKYAELKYMVEHNVLWDDQFYNQFIGIKLRNLKQVK